MIIGFVLFIIALLLLYILKINIKEWKLIIDHNFLLISGFIYYWYLPLIPYEIGDRKNVVLSMDVIESYELVNLEAKILYLVTSLLLILSFVLGEIIFKKKSQLFGFLMYSTGNRGYFTLSIISVILVLQKVLKGFQLISSVVVIIGLSVLNAIWGLIRVKYDVTFFKIAQNFLMEPGYVGMTLISFLNKNELHLIEFPIPLLSNVIGMIPSILFPEKFKYIQAIAEMGKPISVFQGTTHNYVELMVNFGLIGSMIFMFLLSLTLNFLKRNESLSGIYIAICSFLPFFFFRDFPNTLIKYILEFTVIQSVLLYNSGLIIQKIKNRIISI